MVLWLGDGKSLRSQVMAFKEGGAFLSDKAGKVDGTWSLASGGGGRLWG